MKENKARTFLTLFGITIGIALVIIVLSAGNALKGLVLNQVDSFGDDWIEIEVKIPDTNHISAENASSMARGVTITTLTHQDALAIKNLDNISYVYSGVTGQATASYKNARKRPTIFAVSADYITIDKGNLSSGRFFTNEEDLSVAQVVVLGHKIAKDLFGNEDPVGQSLKLDSKSYRVIGLAEEKGAAGFFNFDEVIFIPLRTAQKKMLGIDHVLFIVAQTINNEIAQTTAEEIKWLMRERHDITNPDKDDFAVITMEESVAIVDTIFLGITWLLIGLSAISLAVAGVGIMNVMYVSVVERTFEIGLRKSVGATKKDILWQFLIEAVVITLFGGVIGIVCGILFSLAVSLIAQTLGFAWGFSISILSIFLSLLFAAVVGFAFGVYPARRAANMDPIEAMRKE